MPRNQPICDVNSFIPALFPPLSSYLPFDSAIRPWLVPRNGVESKSQTIQKAARQHGGVTFPIRKGPDGELAVR